MDLRTRKDRIFDVIVRAYIETAEPVGSRTLSKRSDLGLSAASIRNVMADLEEAGLLTQPHTSAGRVPTDQGYRYWVDRLMEREELAPKEREWARKELSKARSAAALADQASKVASRLTESAALVYVKNLKRISFLNQVLQEMVEAQNLLDCLEESELFIEGASRIFDQPEFQDIRKIKHLIQAFDDQDELIKFLLEDLDEEGGGVHLHIGREVLIPDLEDVSIVSKDCYVSRVPIASVAVMGPTRMNYQKIVAVVEFVADATGEELRRF